MPQLLYPWWKKPCTLCVGGRVGIETDLDIFEMRKPLGLASNQTPNYPAHNLDTIPTMLPQLLTKEK